MPRRAAGSSPPSTRMSATMFPAALPRTASRSRTCSSNSCDRSVLMGELFGVTGFVQQDFERGNVGVPLDQRWQRTKVFERDSVKLPNRRRNPRTVVVNQDVYGLGSVMAGQVELANRRARKRLYIGDRVETKIPRADIDVIDVTKYAAACPTSDLAYEFRFGDR